MLTIADLENIVDNSLTIWVNRGSKVEIYDTFQAVINDLSDNAEITSITIEDEDSLLIEVKE